MGDLHRELVLTACRWLAKTEKCTRVFAEVQSTKLNEFPDAIGYRYNYNHHETVVVEAKVSVVDFKRDMNKFWKTGALDRAQMSGVCGMGTRRYYIVPEGLIKLKEVPEDHGLLYVMPTGKVKRVRTAPYRECRDVSSEISILCTMLQRQELGLRWWPDKFRFETRKEHEKRMGVPHSRRRKRR